MKRNILFFAVMMLTMAGFAQQAGPNISWDENNYDFGEINEEGGKVTHKFSFTNTGSAPLVITHVKPSCGCTSSDYTKAPVPPGEKGYVSATYNPLRRPGAFNKSITVTTNSTPPTSTIRFRGNVIPKPKTKADLFPKTVGTLNMKSSHVTFSRIYNTETVTKSFDVINLKEEPLTLGVSNIPSHLKIAVEPTVLQPQQEGKILVTYNASERNDWGFLIDKINLVINGQTNTSDRLTVSATLTEDFRGLSERELAEAPVASFSTKSVDFGAIKQGEVKEHKFTLTNTGKSPLIIRKVKSSCGCTVVKPEETEIKPGKSTNFGVSFNSRGRKGAQSKTITVITNDPQNSTIRLRVKGDVVIPGQEKM